MDLQTALDNYKEGIEFGQNLGAGMALFRLRINEISELKIQLIHALYDIADKDFSRESALEAVHALVDNLYDEIKKKEQEYDKAKDSK